MKKASFQNKSFSLTPEGSALIIAAKNGLIPETENGYDLEIAKKFVSELHDIRFGNGYRCNTKHMALALMCGQSESRSIHSENTAKNECGQSPENRTTKAVKNLEQALISLFFGCLGGLLALILKFG